MEGAELSLRSGRKRKVPSRLLSEEGKEPTKSKKKKHSNSNDELRLAAVTTPKGKKKIPEFSLGSDHDFLSPPKGDLVVVLALSAGQSGEKKAEKSNSSAKTYRRKKLDLTPKLELADKKKEMCVDLHDRLPISHFLHEPKRKKRSKRAKRKAVDSLVNPDSVGQKLDHRIDGKVDGCRQEDLPNKSAEVVPSEIQKKRRSSQKDKLTLENGVNGLPNALINNCSDHQSDEKICNSSIVAEVGHKVDNDSTHQNPEIPIKKKRRSGQGKKLALKSGEPKALVNNSTDQKLNEEKSNVPDRKISTSLITAKISHKADADTCELQNEEAPVKKSSEAASRTADVHREVLMVKSEVKKKRRSDQSKKPALESGEPKALVNNSSDQNLNEEKSNLSDGNISTKLITAKISHKADADTCELQNEEASVNRSSEAASRTADEHGEVHRVQPEVKKKRRSGQGKKLVLASEANKMPDSVVNCDSGQSLIKEKSDLLDGKISTAQVAGPVSDRVALDTSELRNQDAPVNKSSVTTSRAADTHEEVNMVHSDIKKKRRSNQGKKFALETGAPKALENNSLDQNLKEEKSDLPDGKISASLIAAKVSHKADADTCELQNQETPANESSEAASKTADAQGEVYIVQSEIGKKRRSQGKKLVSAIGASKLPNPLVNDHSDQSLIEEKLNLLDGKFSTAQSAAEPGHKVGCDTCELENLDAPVNKNSEAASRKARKHEEVNMVQSEVKKKTIIKKHMLESERNLLSNTVVGNILDQHLMAGKSDISDEKTTATSPIIGSEANHKVDNTTLCEDENREVGVDAAPQVSNTEQELCETGQKRKRRAKKHKKEKMNTEDVRSDDKVIGTFIYDSPPERSASPEQANIRQSPKKRKEKKHKKEKGESTIHQAEASDVGKEVVSASLIKSSVKEAASSIGDARSDDVMIETQIIDANLLKSPASPERAHTCQPLKKLLILDLNGLLVDIVCDLPKGCKADTWVSRKALVKRPFCDDFLKFCFETFNVAVWSSRTKRNVDTVVDFIMGGKKHKLLFCWDQYHCTKTGFPTVENNDKTMVLKELRKVWNKGKPDLPWERGEYNESNTLLLDDSPYKALLNPRHTAIFPDSYDCRNRKDNALGPGGSLRKYLEGLATADNVQKYIEENPFGQRAVTSKNASWKYYVNVMKANRFRIPV